MFNSSSPAEAFAPHFNSPLPASSYPVYHVHRADLVPGMTDKVLSLVAPLVVYWAFSLFFHLLDSLNWDALERHRIHEPEEVKTKNRVTPGEVVVAVLLQQVIQTVVGFVWLVSDEEVSDPAGDLNAWGRTVAKVVIGAAGTRTGGEWMAKHGQRATELVYWWALPTVQMAFAFFVLDGWQYMMHRTAHQVTFLYRTVHSWHHRLYVPYAYGALYNHPLEGFALDTCGSGLAHAMAGLSTRQAVLFFALSTLKTVDDHCGFAFPWDPLQHLFGNNADYHDIHHQVAGLKKNYSQPWFISWDIFFNTRMTRAEFQSKVAKRFEDGEVPPSVVNGPNELAAPPTSKRNGIALKEKVN
ncbi:putative sphingosine hydroxylase [Rhodotorula diobovata]|uniref:Putative sphingosine hydroxylase n=1 Tax=Rhodotorula diobovata TaxID=5288 RepID=A0A5C5FXM0_9BASI|nr:putative sphingosine hydroxylase [Rhodotorula diobovata]